MQCIVLGRTRPELFRSANLSSSHPASKWHIATSDTFQNYETVNALGVKYANLPDGIEKEEIMAALLECFHGYLMKYLNMIVRGHLPPIKSAAGQEAAKFLKLLAPKGNSEGRLVLSNICHTLHLAFKQASTDDIYDSLLMCLMRAVKKYDPFYVEKVKKACEAIDVRCKRKPKRIGTTPEFTTEDIAQDMGISCVGYLRKLVKLGFLHSISDTKKKVIGYRRVPKKWPPPASQFKSGRVGFTYFIPLYFRFYLHEHISEQMRSIESREGMLQLDQRFIGNDSGTNIADPGIPSSDGAFTDSDGSTWAADVSLINLQLDISSMTEEWVKDTDDRLFRNLEVTERYLLYLLYVKEMKWADIASTMGSDPKTVRSKYEDVMTYLRGRAKRKNTWQKRKAK